MKAVLWSIIKDGGKLELLKREYIDIWNWLNDLLELARWSFYQSLGMCINAPITDHFMCRNRVYYEDLKCDLCFKR
jgi:hypothetical protein